MTTVKVKSAHPESQGPYVVIDASQFDPAVHELLEGELLPQPSISGELMTASAGPSVLELAAEAQRIEHDRNELVGMRDALVRRERELDEQAQTQSDYARANKDEAGLLEDLRAQLDAEGLRLKELAATLEAKQSNPPSDPATWSKDQLQAALDEKGIKYPAAANKADLLALLTTA